MRVGRQMDNTKPPSKDALALGLVKSYTYEAANHLVATVQPLGNQTGCSSYGFLMPALMDALSHGSSYTSGRLYRRTGEAKAEGIVTTYKYDKRNYLTSMDDNAAKQKCAEAQLKNCYVTYVYDDSGKLVTIIYPSGN
jgi:YD repeat-containing protein